MSRSYGSQYPETHANDGLCRKYQRVRRRYSYYNRCGGSGIRTHEASRPPAFQAGTIVRSVIPPLTMFVEGRVRKGRCHSYHSKSIYQSHSQGLQRNTSICRFRWTNLFFTFLLTHHFGLCFVTCLCLRGFAPSTTIDDFEEVAPVLVILAFGE